MKFTKYHALGNDYLVLDPADAPQMPSPKDVERICHRNFGLGSDGILYGPLPSKVADFALEIWNPDGSQAEKSGNGLRIFTRYLYDIGRVGKDPFQIQTLGGIVSCRVEDPLGIIEVEMGPVSFRSDVIPATGPEREVLNETVSIHGHEYTYCAATVGNPHVVLPLPEISESLARSIGPVLENMTDRFPNRTNVQLLQVLDRNNIRIEIWERGAGYTLASGSSSSAAAAVAYKLGLCDNNITVHCPGGNIGIHISPDFCITMRGPATRVGSYLMDPELLH